MSAYKIRLSKEADKGLAKLYKSEPKAYDKAIRLLEEIGISPYHGTGKPEALKGTLAGAWSRRITQRHRLVYKVYEDKIAILVLQTYGHYDDK